MNRRPRLARSRLAAIAATLAVAALAFAAVACGEPADEDPTPVLTPPLTPASGTPRSTATAAQTPAASPDAGETPAETPSNGNGGGEAQEFTIVGLNTLFDETEFEATAGTIKFTFENKDGGILHNLAFYEGEDATGELVGATELKTGPATDVIELEFAAGTYFFQCDAHPATMAGTLTVT